MSKHPLELLIEKADTAINSEDFETLISLYSDDAVLVIKPGKTAVGKEQIKKAFEDIAVHFEHSLEVKQDCLEILETNETALVLAKTIVSAKNQTELSRKATYVFKKDSLKGWRKCYR